MTEIMRVESESVRRLKAGELTEADGRDLLAKHGLLGGTAATPPEEPGEIVPRDAALSVTTMRDNLDEAAKKRMALVLHLQEIVAEAVANRACDADFGMMLNNCLGAVLCDELRRPSHDAGRERAADAVRARLK